MSLLAAAVPVAVLVLAWDETTPAVRALVEATDPTTPALDSMVVLVPAAAGEPTQEEFFPLVPEPTPLPAAAKAASSPDEAAPADDVRLPSDTVPTDEVIVAMDMQPVLPGPLTLSPPPALGVLAEGPLPKPAAPTAAVRVLSLSRFSLPELVALSHQALPRPIWQGNLAQPTAPYLGSQAAPASGETPDVATLAPTPLAAAAGANLVEDSPLSPSPIPANPAQPAQSSTASPTQAPDYLLADVPSLDAEADLAPLPPDELATGEAAAAPTNAQADWAEALASLRTPLPIEEPAPNTDLEDEAAYYAATVGETPAVAASGPAELRPPSRPFEAPDLNFQVIQYARFAVPVALAQAPFAVIYAPAWPTWLAAQELRYRMRQPLVLHVATLAASEEESVATATGWQAELQRQALQRADLILTETPELTRRLRHDLGLPPELVRTVPAADTAAVAQALRTAQLRPTVNPG